jgi:hypothetical protein
MSEGARALSQHQNCGVRISEKRLGVKLMILTTLIFSFALIPLSQRALAEGPRASTHPPLPHMDLNMTGSEYETLLSKNTQPYGKHGFEEIFATGKRNLDWIRLLNNNRKQRLSLSTAETQQGFPIDNPRVYNPEIIHRDYANLKSTMPSPLKEIIFGTEALPDTLPCADETYIQWGLAVDRIYQIAARWRTYEPYMDYLRENAFRDIRGYYFLNKTPDLRERLGEWSRLTPSEQQLTLGWLTQICVNDLQDQTECSQRAQRAASSNSALAFYEQHRTASETILSEMMLIPENGHFESVQWKSENSIEIPFREPESESMKAYLRDNIQEEWQLNPFNLIVNFVSGFVDGVQVIWKPGVTPHVDRLGSDTIYMDANAPISEYDVQWTIRHEFGHVLGFPDCYLELYDSSLEAIVGYQLDTSDLMCSRRGHLKPRHISELRRAYPAR